MVTGSYIVTLNVNGLNATTKRHRPGGWMKTCACMHYHLPIIQFDTSKLHVIILYC